jgi:hypothetical protein
VRGGLTQTPRVPDVCWKIGGVRLSPGSTQRVRLDHRRDGLRPRRRHQPGREVSKRKKSQGGLRDVARFRSRRPTTYGQAAGEPPDRRRRAIRQVRLSRAATSSLGKRARSSYCRPCGDRGLERDRGQGGRAVHVTLSRLGRLGRDRGWLIPLPSRAVKSRGPAAGARRIGELERRGLLRSSGCVRAVLTVRRRDFIPVWLRHADDGSRFAIQYPPLGRCLPAAAPAVVAERTAQAATRASAGRPRGPRSTSPMSVLTAPRPDGR